MSKVYLIAGIVIGVIIVGVVVRIVTVNYGAQPVPVNAKPDADLPPTKTSSSPDGSGTRSNSTDTSSPTDRQVERQ